MLTVKLIEAPDLVRRALPLDSTRRVGVARSPTLMGRVGLRYDACNIFPTRTRVNYFPAESALTVITLPFVGPDAKLATGDGIKCTNTT